MASGTYDSYKPPLPASNTFRRPSGNMSNDVGIIDSYHDHSQSDHIYRRLQLFRDNVDLLHQLFLRAEHQHHTTAMHPEQVHHTATSSQMRIIIDRTLTHGAHHHPGTIVAVPLPIDTIIQKVRNR